MTRMEWEIVLDDLYEMGGYGEYPNEQTERDIDENINILLRLDMTRGEIEEAAVTLRDSGLVEFGETVDSPEDKPPNRRRFIQLEKEGFNLAHDRRQAEQSRTSNQSVALLTLVLAIVGLAQATALSAQISSFPENLIAGFVTLVAAAFLVMIYRRLYSHGILDIESLGNF